MPIRRASETRFAPSSVHGCVFMQMPVPRLRIRSKEYSLKREDKPVVRRDGSPRSTRRSLREEKRTETRLSPLRASLCAPWQLAFAFGFDFGARAAKVIGNL